MRRVLLIVLAGGLALTGCGSSADEADAGALQTEAIETTEPISEADQDGDGVPDDEDACPDNPDASREDDSDCDGVIDSIDYAPDDPDVQDAPDSDGDGVRDSDDAFPDDALRAEAPPPGALDGAGDAFERETFTEPDQVWCQRAAVFGSEGLDELSALADDPTGVSNDWDAVRWLAGEFEALEQEAPDDALAADASTQQDVLQSMLDAWYDQTNGTIARVDYAGAAASSLLRCGDLYLPPS